MNKLARLTRATPRASVTRRVCLRAPVLSNTTAQRTMRALPRTVARPTTTTQRASMTMRPQMRSFSSPMMVSRSFCQPRLSAQKRSISRVPSLVAHHVSMAQKSVVYQFQAPVRSFASAAEQLEQRLMRTDSMFPELHIKEGIADINKLIKKAESDPSFDAIGEFMKHLNANHTVTAALSSQINSVVSNVRSLGEYDNQFLNVSNDGLTMAEAKKLTLFPELIELQEKILAKVQPNPQTNLPPEREQRLFELAEPLISEAETAFDFLNQSNQDLRRQDAEIDYYRENIDLLTVEGELRKAPALIQEIDEDIVYNRWSHDEEED